MAMAFITMTGFVVTNEIHSVHAEDIGFDVGSGEEDGEYPYTVHINSEGYLLKSLKPDDVEKKALEGTYKIYASEDIQVDADKTFAKDSMVAEVKTDDSGKGQTTLPEGKYYVIEDSLKSEFIDKDTAKKEFSLNDQTQETFISFSHIKPFLSLTIQGPDTGGFKYTVYAESDITDADGNVLIKKGDQVGDELVADSHGKATVKNLPNYLYAKDKTAPYKVKVSAAPSAYTKDVLDEEYAWDAKKDGTISISATVNVLNLTAKNVKKVTYEIYTQDGENWSAASVQRGTFDEEKKIEGLEMGLTYRLVVSAPGYKAVDPIDFEYTQNGQNVDLEFTKTRASLSVKDASDGAFIANAVLKIKDSDGNILETVKTQKEAVVVEGLVEGTYTVEQTSATKGYVKSSEAALTVSKTEDTELVVKDERVSGYLEIYLVTSVNRDPISDGEFVIKDGETEVTTVLTDETGMARTTYIPIGRYENGEFKEAITYTIQQTATKDGYVIDSNPYNVTFEYLDDDTKTVYKKFTMPNKVASGEQAKTKTVAKKVSGGSSGTNGGVSSVGTGDSTNMFYYLLIALGGILLVGTSAVAIRKAKKEN